MAPENTHATVLSSAGYVKPNKHCQSDTILIVENPRHLKRIQLADTELLLPLSDLTWAERECTAIRGLANPEAVTTLVRDEASQDAVRQALLKADCVHFACHGVHVPVDYMASGVLLSDEDRLSIRDILTIPMLTRHPLIVMSTCQSAIPDFVRLHGDRLGLPHAFLTIGARGVVGSLWPVADISSHLLISRFWQHLIGDNMTGPEALAASQRWLRDSSADELGLADALEHWQQQSERPAEFAERIAYYRSHGAKRPFSAPYFWAGYVYTGTA